MTGDQARDGRQPAHAKPQRWGARPHPPAFLVVAVVLLLCGIVVAGAYELAKVAEQDQCSFGPISNARYLEWLANARALRRREGNLIGYRSILAGLERRPRLVSDVVFDEFSRGVTSVEERLAIVHAMMRADGFSLLAVEPDLPEPYAASDSHIGYKYGKYSIFGLLLLCRFDCMDRAFANLHLKNRPGTYRKNEIRFSYGGGPDLESLTRYRVPPPQYPRACPPMPSPEWAAHLIAPESIR